MSILAFALIVAASLDAAFRDAEIIPDVLDEAPGSLLQVTFGENEVNLGNELTPTQVQNQPKLSWATQEDSSFYTLIMVDPDAPSRLNPTRRSILHWLVVNIPGGDLSQGDVLAEYLGSAPPQGSDLHRYIQLVFEQNGQQEFDLVVEDRANFSVRNFTDAYDLGEAPVAGNFFVAQWEDTISLEATFKDAEIIPDVLDEAPSSLLQVTFGENEVNLGNELTPTQVQNQPIVSWGAEEESFYSLIFLDPDAPSKDSPTSRNFLHWLVVNVPGVDVSRGDVLAEFKGSAPSQGSDLHRYTLLVLKQEGRQEFQWTPIPVDLSEGRRYFSVRNFTATYGLEETPVAGNFYLAQWDESGGEKLI